MKWKMNLNAVNQFSKGTEIYTEGEAVESVALVLKGRIQVRNDGAKFLVNSGTFLGINDLYEGSYQSTYTALDDVIVYVFAANRREELDTILSINKDYHGFLVASLSRTINELDQIYQGLLKISLGLQQFITEQYQVYLEAAARYGFNTKTSERLSSLSIFQSDLELERDRINYYKEFIKLPIDIVKAFYSHGNTITLYQAEDQVDIINQQIEELKKLSEEFVPMIKCLIDDSETCLFHIIASFAIEIEVSDGNSKAIMDIMDMIIEKINLIENFYERMLGSKLVINRKKMEEAYHLLLTGGKDKSSNALASQNNETEALDRIVAEFEDTFQKLLEYAEIDSDKAQEMQNTMLDFINLKDRLSSDDNARSIRRHVTDNHYIIYKAIFLKAYKDKQAPKIVELFLKYGYADERLLSKEQLHSLYNLKEENSPEDMIHIYNIREWLTLIYEGKKEPSKNEFDQEYNEMLATLKKQGKYSEKELLELSKNPESKLDYEIQNMFRYNNKTTNGQISTFVPVLHKDMLMNQLDKSFLTPAKVVTTLKELIKIDFSIFDRETIYSDSAKKIVKEYIIKRVYPDIILMPTVGNNGVMWQEITGKKRDSAGRFLFPIFCETNLSSIMIRVFGRFRWEMCRCIEGTAWNDITHKSLTSEYSDYLQFYRKNRELSEEKKDKIKLQIQRGRNSREIFVLDYEQWINYEFKGAIKLNKPVREIMATYCPFSKDIREQLMLSPLFEESMARYHRDKQKKIREIESRYRLLQKDQIDLTNDLIDTLNYYKDL